MINVTISFRIDEKQRKYLEEKLGKDINFTFLKDASYGERPFLIRKTDVLFSWNPTRELKNATGEDLKI